MAVDWLSPLPRRYAEEDLRFSAESLDETVKLPADGSKSVAENLPQSALEKRRMEPIGTIARPFGTRQCPVPSALGAGRWHRGAARGGG